MKLGNKGQQVLGSCNISQAHQQRRIVFLLAAALLLHSASPDVGRAYAPVPNLLKNKFTLNAPKSQCQSAPFFLGTLS